MASHNSLVFKIGFGVFCNFLAFLYLPTTVYAQIRFTEVLAAPESGSEWVEIANFGSTAVSIQNWSVWDTLSSPDMIDSFEGTIEPNTLKIMTVNPARLNNTGDTVVLKNAAGTTIDSVSYNSVNIGVSWQWTVENGWFEAEPTMNAFSQPQPIPTPQPSPSPSASPTPSPTPQPTTAPSPIGSPQPSASPATYTTNAITISSIIGCPETGSESVFLTNTTSDSISLSGWYILDSSNNKRLLTGTIPALQSLEVSFSSSFINNTGDDLFLYSPTNQLITSKHADDCTQTSVDANQTGSNSTSTQPLTSQQQSSLPTSYPTNTLPSRVLGIQSLALKKPWQLPSTHIFTNTATRSAKNPIKTTFTHQSPLQLSDITAPQNWAVLKTLILISFSVTITGIWGWHYLSLQEDG